MKTKMMGMIGTAALIALLGTGAYGYAAQEHPGAKQAPAARPQQAPHAQAARPAQQQHAQPQARQQTRQAPAPVRQQAQPKHQAARAPQKQRAQQRPPTQQARSNQQVKRTPQQQQFQQSTWQQHRAGNWQSDHRTWAQRGGYNGYRIPSDRFNGYFGQGHGFRIGGLPFQVVSGYPRFQYGGYWFSLLDPYPGNWSSDWYDTDDVYVNYVDNGYYLFNTRYPGIGLAISISL